MGEDRERGRIERDCLKRNVEFRGGRSGREGE